ncbi:hypothetical protein DRN63_03125 [Nanoarchaeota archaeon]|nr:MAG: hypothetical protein DRN63_03125 [Nanoarchaeota archaeon]
MLLGLSMVASALAVPMDEWRITIESEVQLSEYVGKGVIGVAEYIVREEVQEWEEYVSIECFCRVMGKEEEMYMVNMTINAERADGEAVHAKVLFEYDAQSGGYVIKEVTSKLSTDNDEEASTASPSLSVSVSLWSRFELSREAEKRIKDAAERLVKERINIKGLGGVAAECFVLKSEGERYVVYIRVFGKPPSGTSEASEGKAKTWEATFKYDPEHGTYEAISFSEVDNFLVREDTRQKAMMICEKDEKIKAFLAENAEKNLTLHADWISRQDGIVRLIFAAFSALNKTHALYRGLIAYIDLKGEEAFHVQKYKG